MADGAAATQAVDRTSSTPTSWRVAALGMLGFGLLAGLLTARAAGTARLARLAALATAGVVLPLAAAARRPPIPPDAVPLDPSARPPTFTVLVAARDEATVLAALVGDVAAQDHRDSDGSPRFELVVVDDRSTDGTVEVVATTAARAGIADVTRVIRRSGDGLPDGKGAALTAAQPGVCRGDVVVVLDADARIGPSFLTSLASYVAAGAVAVTARRRILDAGRGWLAEAQADEQTLDGEIQRGRWAMGGCSEFRGNGIVVRRDLLMAVGGWRAEALTEDLDLSSRVAAAHGVRVAWAIDAEVWEEPVRTLRGLRAQRARWAEGGLRRLFEHGPAVISSRALSRRARFDFAAYAGQLAIPPVVVGAITGAVLTRRPGPAATLVAAYLGVGSTLAWDALRWELDGRGGSLTKSDRAFRAVRAGLFNGVWLLAVPEALWRLATRRGSVGYVKMDHLGEGAGAPPA